MFGYLGCDRKNLAVRNCGHTVDLAVMIVNEPNVFDERTKALPCRERRGLDQQSGQLPIFATGMSHPTVVRGN